MWSDPLVTRHIGGKPFTEQQTWARILSYIGHWSLMDFGYWAIEERSTAIFIGELGFADFKRNIDPALHGIPELGWALASQVHGKGYATEAVRAVLSWGDKRFDSGQAVCIISPENIPSIRVAEKCGFQKYQDTTYNGVPTSLFMRKPKSPI
jgi:RimJ/RimL family protein N-acetyltransferase